MRSRIHLVRHGVSAHVHDGSWVDGRAAQRFVEAYDAAGIVDAPPPDAVVAAAANADVLAASDLPRALESLESVAPGRGRHVTPLLREIDFESPGRWPIRLPIPVWDSIDYFINGYRIARRLGNANMARGDAAADWLESRVGGDVTLLAVTHGGFRRFLCAALVDRGWIPEFTRGRYHNWSVWSFRAPSATPR